MRTSAVYEITFSERRFVKLLEDAGFSVVSPSEAVGKYVRLVSSPGDKVELEIGDPPEQGRAIEWRRMERTPVETVKPGQYL